MNKVVQGVSAAVLTPRLPDDQIDVAAVHALIGFLAAKGILSYAMNGATGEYTLTTPEQLCVLLKAVKDASGNRAQIICGVGANSLSATQALIRVAEDCNAQALLLPAPSFFRYEQQDLAAYASAVAASTRLPVLLYNLPQFTNGYEAATVEQLIIGVPNIVGLKDSSGSLDILTQLTRNNIDAVRIVGNDSVYASGLDNGVVDGVISGVACVLPELMLAIESNFRSGNASAVQAAANLLEQYIDQLVRFPAPWGLKFTAQTRGIFTPHIPIPLSSGRTIARDTMMAWLQKWIPAALSTTSRG
jgi:4-hydroxy-tetrahydrodipicolinate synthase